MALRATAAIGISKKDDKSIASGFDHAQRTSDNTFSIFFIDGSKVDLTIPLPENGVSVTGMTAIDARHFAWDFSDGTQSAPIEYPQAEVTISAETGNALVNKADGLYVSSTGVEISAETGNTLESKADGLFVGHDATKVDVNQTVANAGKALIVGADGNVTVGDAGVKVSTKAGNDIEEITDAGEEGIYVSVPVKAVTVGATDLTPDSTGKITVAIDPDTNNQISYGANGFLVEHDSAKVDVDQTVANAGKALVVGADGMVTTGDAGVKRSSKTGNSIEEITEAGQEGIYVPPIPKRSAKAGNALVELTDEGEEGLYVAPASISISQEENNALTSKADGLFAEGHEHEAYTTDEIDAFFTGTTEEIEAYSKLIKDTETSTLSIWSSKKTSDELDSKADSTVIGDLTDLETTEKTSVVGAVNEVNSAVSTVKDSLDSVKKSYSNPNLLDNGWFQCNSRGKTAYPNGKGGFAIDRYRGLNGSERDTYITVNENGTVTFTNTTSNAILFVQDTKYNDLSLDKYTLSILDSDNNIFKSSKTSNAITENGELRLSFRSKSIVGITLSPNCNITIKAFKLELGSVSTLANDTAPDYQTELLKCQSSTSNASDTYANKSLFPPISDAWLSTKAYAVGDYAIHNNLLWKCLIANTGTTPVEGTTWTQTSVGSEVNKISVPIQLTKEDVFKDYEDVESFDGYRIGKIYVITRLIISSTSLSSSKETFSKCHVKSKFYNSSLSPHLLGHTVGTNGYGVFAAIQTYGGTDDGILSMSLTTPNVTHTGRLIFAPFTLVEI